jgi:hypothetical protein
MQNYDLSSVHCAPVMSRLLKICFVSSLLLAISQVIGLERFVT